MGLELGDREELPSYLAISVSNLARLGFVPPGGDWEGSVDFGRMTVTGPGMALFQACS
jgi:hypothetical protein